MQCKAILFNIEVIPSRNKPGQINNFLTFIDEDTGESHRTYVSQEMASRYQKMKTVDISLSMSAEMFNGLPQLNIRIHSMTDRIPSASVANDVVGQGTNTTSFFKKTGT